LDSYLSLKNNGWVILTPPTLDEYCKRYLEFLRTHETIPRFKYEDFVEAPQPSMNHLSDLLGLTFSENFIDLFSVFRLTGDSGRGGDRIEMKARRPIDGSLQDEIANAPHYLRLLDLLEYTP
jgi:hypothetical protein